MDKKCDVCEFLKDPKLQILTTDRWNAGIGNNHAYLGRAFVSLNVHKGSLSELDTQDWEEFQRIVRKLEPAYKKAFGAVPLNWGCFMNNAFQSDPVNPHVHWHIFPRYKVAPVVDGITFDDPLYGRFYDDKAEHMVSDETAEKIAQILRDNI